jgi:hypothetical protein
MLPALRVGAVVVALGAVAALALGGRIRAYLPEALTAGVREEVEGVAA